MHVFLVLRCQRCDRTKKKIEASLSMKIPLLVAFRKGFNEVGFEGAKALNPHSSQLFVVHLFSGNFNQKQKKTHIPTWKPF